MEPFNLRSIPFAQLDRIVTERVYVEPPLRTVLDNHTFGHSRRRYRVEARNALGLWMEIYLYARNDVEPDENVDVERGGDLTHEVIFTEPILHFAENYFRQLSTQPARNILQPPTGCPMKDFVRDFEMLCSTGVSPEGHLLVWQALADMCRFVCEDYWKGIELDFGVIKPSPEASEAAARCFIADDEYAHLVEYEDGKRVCAAALGGDPYDWWYLGQWYELAAEFCSERLPPVRDIKNALRDFCWITNTNNEAPGSYQAPQADSMPEPSCRVREVLSGLRAIAHAAPSHACISKPAPEAYPAAAVSAMRGFANLVTSGACRSFNVTNAWLYHILHLRCEWEIADILGGQSPR